MIVGLRMVMFWRAASYWLLRRVRASGSASFDAVSRGPSKSIGTVHFHPPGRVRIKLIGTLSLPSIFLGIYHGAVLDLTDHGPTVSCMPLMIIRS